MWIAGGRVKMLKGAVKGHLESRERERKGSGSDSELTK